MRPTSRQFGFIAVCITIILLLYAYNFHRETAQKIKDLTKIIESQWKNAGIRQVIRVNGTTINKADEQPLINQPLKKFGSSFTIRNKFINIFNETGANLKADCVTLRVSNRGVGNSKICIYNTTDDMFVSGSLRGSGSWEGGTLSAFGEVVSSHPDLLVLDVGCQVGTYTLYANKLGAKVIAVDAFKKNLQLLSKSLHLIHQEDNVVLLWNAMVSHHGKFSLGFHKKNIGGTYLRNETAETNLPEEARYLVQGLKLDDLVDSFELENKKVFIKIDIEGFELDAFYGGDEFFRRVNVCYIYMEFVTYTKKGQGQLVFDLLETYGLYPYGDPYFRTRLEAPPKPKTKPDVFFAKKDGLCSK